MSELHIYPRIMEGLHQVKQDDHVPKRIEISRKFRAKLISDELPGDYDKSTFGPHLEGIFDVDDVEVRDDIEGFKIIAEMPGKTVVRTLNGEEVL